MLIPFCKLTVVFCIFTFCGSAKAADNEGYILSPSTTMKTGTKDYIPDFLFGKQINEKPRISYIVELPSQMKTALKRYSSEFEIWKQEDFDPFLIRTYNFTPYQSPSTVIGDFNNDKMADTILMGHDKTYMMTIVLLSKGNKYGIFEISKRLLIDPASSEHKRAAGSIIEFLVYVPPGRIAARPEYDRPELNLKSDAFEIGYFEKSSSIWFYKDGKFVSYTMSD